MADRFQDLLLLALENDDLDLFFLLLMEDEQQEFRETTYDPSLPPFNLHDLTDIQSWAFFRFYPKDIIDMVNLLQIPDKLVIENGCTVSGIDALCILLKRFSYPCRLMELERFFVRPKTTISMIINTLVDLLYANHKHRLTFDARNSWVDNAHLQLYADTIHNKGAPLPNVFGFIDGTVRPICRPTTGQRVCYNGHKRIHSIKFQSVVIPNGLIAHLYGPLEGRRHDIVLLRESGILQELEQMGPDRENMSFALYGDPAYPVRADLLSPFPTRRKRALSPDEQEFNRLMSSVRECVEWEFGNILRNFAFLDFRKNLKVLLSPVAKYYLVGGLLTNCHTCFYGNQTSRYFNLDPPTIQEYLAA